MPAPARFPAGITDRSVRSIFGDHALLDQVRYARWFVEFTGLDYIPSQWTVTETDAASTQNLVAADAGGEYGILSLSQAGASATAVNSIQLTTASAFISDLSKRWILLGRLSRDNADESMGFGMQAVNATPFALVNAVWCEVLANSTAVNFKLAKASAVTTASVAAAYPTSALNNFITLGMSYDGRSKVKCFIDGVQRAEITTLTNFPNTAALLPTISSQNSTAAARNVHVDYFLFAVER